MFKYIVRRLLQAIPTLFGISILSFMIMSAAPGGPTAALALDPNLTAEDRAIREAQLGVNDPWYLQYLYWLIGDDWRMRDIDGDGEGDMYGQREGVLRGDFGNSITRDNRPVEDLIIELALPTIELTGSALLVGLVFGLTIGILSAIWRGGIFDNISRVLAVFFNAVPNFWLGLMLIMILALQLNLFPAVGRCPSPDAAAMMSGDVGCPPIYQRLEYLILPTFTLGTVYIAIYSRYMRASMLEVIGQDYIRTAQSKGLNGRTIWFRHGARNALIPIATFLGPAITTLLGGAVLTEQIFSWPGLGRRTVLAVTQQDYPFIMAIVILGAVTTILGYLLSDILYALIDPRVRFS